MNTEYAMNNPDWAVYLEEDGDKKLYFVLETKGNSFEFALSPSERLKYNCGKAHFRALDSDVKTSLASRWSEVGV